MSLYKTIDKPTLGVMRDDSTGRIQDRAWTRLQQLRAENGVISNFPGWTSILASGSVDTFGTLLTKWAKGDGTVFLLAGGATKLYKYMSGTKTLTDITGALSLAPTRDKPWTYAAFLDAFYITQLVNGLHKWTGVGNYAAVVGAPKARAIGVLFDYLCLFNVDDGTARPWRFQWAAEATDSTWTAAATNDAGSFDLRDTDDIGVALYRLGNDLIAYKEASIIPISFIGGNEVFGRQQTIGDLGLLSPYSIVPREDGHMVMGPYSFYWYTGGRYADNSIGDPIHDLVYSRLDVSKRHRIRTLNLLDSDEVAFIYPVSGGVLNDADEWVIYNFTEKNWYGPFNKSVSIAGSSARGVSVVIDDITTIIDNDDTIIDESGGTEIESRQNLFIDQTGNIHQVGLEQGDNGSAIIREAESGDQPLFDGLTTKDGTPISLAYGTVMQISAMNIEFQDIANEALSFYVGVKMDLNDAITWKGPFTVKSFNTQGIRVPVRGTGRWARVRFNLSNSRRIGLIGYQYEVNPVGRR